MATPSSSRISFTPSRQFALLYSNLKSPRMLRPCASGCFKLNLSKKSPPVKRNSSDGQRGWSATDATSEHLQASRLQETRFTPTQKMTPDLLTSPPLSGIAFLAAPPPPQGNEAARSDALFTRNAPSCCETPVQEKHAEKDPSATAGRGTLWKRQTHAKTRPAAAAATGAAKAVRVQSRCSPPHPSNFPDSLPAGATAQTGGRGNATSMRQNTSSHPARS